MARYVTVHSKDGQEHFYINVDSVAYLQVSKDDPTQTIVHFVSAAPLQVNMPAENFKNRAS